MARLFDSYASRATIRLVPGVLIASFVTALALLLEKAEAAVLGRAWLDALVLAILLGMSANTLFCLPASTRPGIRFAGKTLLEIAIVLLGASISLATIADFGIVLVCAVAGVVLVSLLASYAISRLLGLPSKLATLVACGNSICGNSAIVAAAPVIGADSDEVASSISFTAVLGVLVVLGLPLLVPLLSLTEWQYGVIAGMTVYAVPQVLAATVPVGTVSAQIGTVVKLLRVLMLGPVILLLSLHSRSGQDVRPSTAVLFPPFIIGFLGMMILRSSGLIPEAVILSLAAASSLLTLVAMAALGLSVDSRSVLASGGRVLTAGVLSILVLAGMAWLLLRFLTPAA